MFKNFELLQMLEDLTDFLNRSDKIGYVAAVNARKIKQALTEFYSFRDNLILSYGENKKDEDGNPTDTYSVIDPDKIKKLQEEILPILQVDQEVDILKLDFNSDINGKLNGNDMIKITWMIKE